MSGPLAALDVDRNFGKTPLAFEPNQGQWQRPSLFGTHGQGFTAAFSAREVTFHLLQGDKNGKAASIRMQWKGATNGARLNAIDKLPGVSNYFHGNDPSQWKTGVPQYGKIRVDNLYPGIDVVYYGHGRELEYDIEVAPGAEPAQVQLRVEGAQQLRVDHDGNLVIDTAAGDLVQHKPVVYQISGTLRTPIEARYRVRKNNTVAMALSGYDRSRKLVIDPVISWGVALGGNGNSQGTAVGLDGSGNVYLAGYTQATDFPLVNAYDNSLGCTSSCLSDAFLTKISPDGATVLYSTYLGGSLDDQAYALAVDSTGNAYLAGTTHSADFPTKSPYQAALSGTTDAFLAKFNSGGGLAFSTYLGGSGYENPTTVAIDSSGNAYVAGNTTSIDFPTVGAFQSTPGGGTDAFVTNVSPDGSTVVFSTYLGGSAFDNAFAVTIGPFGNIYVAGTASANFPTKNPIEPCSSAFPMAFVTQLAPLGSGVSLLYMSWREHRRHYRIRRRCQRIRNGCRRIGSGVYRGSREWSRLPSPEPNSEL